MKPSRLEVLFSPSEFEALRQRELAGTVCVVFDILRATSSIVTALGNGAASILPVATIEEALRLKKAHPEALLAGERNGLRITGALASGTEFDFGNSPREFTSERVRGKTLIMTTTNGTRGLRACAGADAVLAGSFLNLSAVRDWARQRASERLLLVCSGTHEEASYEDTLAAGALADELCASVDPDLIADSAQLARNVYLAARDNLPAAMQFARNGRRLLSLPDLAEDVPVCLRRDTVPLVAALIEGQVVRLDQRG